MILWGIVCLSACSNGKEGTNDVLLKGMDESLMTASSNLSEANRQLHLAISRNMDDFDQYVYESAEAWQPKALLVSKFSDELYRYMDSLKQGLNNANGSVDEWIGEKGKELYARMKQCRVNLLAVDSTIGKEYQSYKTVIPRSFDSLPEQDRDFTKVFFGHGSRQQTITTLSKFQCDTRAIEHELLSFCWEKANPMILHCGFFSSIKMVAYPSDKHARAGKPLDVTVGLFDAYFKRWKLTITIDGKPTKLNNEGFVKRSITASNQIGKHTVPFKIEYKDFKTGEIKAVIKEVVYYVDSANTNPSTVN